MATSAPLEVGPPKREAPPPAYRKQSAWRGRTTTIVFLVPAAFFLGVFIVYPTVYTVVRSLYDHSGAHFIGLSNYKTLFTTSTLLTAIKNNAVWVAVAPALVTAIGLVFAVLTERVRWSVAFKTAVFMPMAISLFAAGVIWHLMYLQDPSQGAVNAAIGGIEQVFRPPGPLSGAAPSTRALVGSPQSGFTLRIPVHPGSVARIGLTAIPPQDVPKGATQAVCRGRRRRHHRRRVA